MIGRIYISIFNRKISLIESIPIIIGIFLAILIEVYRIVNPIYGGVFRGYNHLLAGIIIPYMFYILWLREDYYKSPENPFIKIISSKDFSCLVYLVICIIWESYQLITRGYMQLDQYAFDLLGIAMIFLVFKYKEVKK